MPNREQSLNILMNIYAFHAINEQLKEGWENGISRNKKPAYQVSLKLKYAGIKSYH